jgi:formate dehydrogenase maturation protein FdhE
MTVPVCPFCEATDYVSAIEPTQPWPVGAFYRCVICDAEWGVFPPETPERRRGPRL